MKVKLAYNLHFDFDILRLEAKLDELTEEQEICFEEIDRLSDVVDNYDLQWCEVYNKILELQKQNDFTSYCTYGKFPNY